MNDEEETETMSYIGELWTERQRNRVNVLFSD